ncbi:hypothetical protein LPJ61_003112 [Coemansia biformis]|uniref:Mediator of RNA polymerase II transcription subunit 9 n=1 Tax=Coemansia biformis TaxID=1286918 RepID=A0A9W8CVU7_9FUNG|nr:hypothetical protein LPJ61_003112 [Coemansia biformis]
MSQSMDALLSQLDEQVETALRTLFPAADDSNGAPNDAQQRAHDFAGQVSAVHVRLTELKGKADEPPSTADTPTAALEKDIAELRRDIQTKDAALAKYRQLLEGHVERLRQIDEENRAHLEGL